MTKSEIDQILAKPILIVGAPRSGTTFLTQLIGCHSAIAKLHEPRPIWKFGNDTKSDCLTKADARPEVVDYIRKRFAEHIRSEGKTRLLEKTPANSLRMEFVDQVLPDCKYIHIIRNGYDASLSIREHWRKGSGQGGGFSERRMKNRFKKRISEVNLRQIPYYGREFLRRTLSKRFSKNTHPIWGPRLPGIEDMVKEWSLYDIACLQWRTCVEFCCDHGRRLGPERYIEIKLEELSQVHLRQVLDFCGLTPEQPMVDYINNTFDLKRSGSRQLNMNEDEKAKMDRWILPTKKWLDY